MIETPRHPAGAGSNSGGVAEASGSNFEQEVQAVYMACLLSDSSALVAPGLPPASAGAVRRIVCQARDVVDDILVELHPAGRLFVEVKSRLELRRHSESELAGVLRKFAEKVRATDFAADRDRVVLVVGASTSTSLVAAWNRLTALARETREGSEPDIHSESVRVRQVAEVVLHHLTSQPRWDSSSAPLWTVFRASEMVRIESADFRACRAALAIACLSDGTKAHTVWELLVGLAGRLRTERGAATRTSLKGYLQSHGFALADATHPNDTENPRAALSRRLRVLADGRGWPPTVAPPALRARLRGTLRSALVDGKLTVLVGPSGAGRTFALMDAATSIAGEDEAVWLDDGHSLQAHRPATSSPQRETRMRAALYAGCQPDDLRNLRVVVDDFGGDIDPTNARQCAAALESWKAELRDDLGSALVAMTTRAWAQLCSVQPCLAEQLSVVHIPALDHAEKLIVLDAVGVDPERVEHLGRSGFLLHFDDFRGIERLGSALAEHAPRTPAAVALCELGDGVLADALRRLHAPMPSLAAIRAALAALASELRDTGEWSFSLKQMRDALTAHGYQGDAGALADELTHANVTRYSSSVDERCFEFRDGWWQDLLCAAYDAESPPGSSPAGLFTRLRLAASLQRPYLIFFLAYLFRNGRTTELRRTLADLTGLVDDHLALELGVSFPEGRAAMLRQALSRKLRRRGGLGSMRFSASLLLLGRHARMDSTAFGTEWAAALRRSSKDQRSTIFSQGVAAVLPHENRADALVQVARLPGLEGALAGIIGYAFDPIRFADVIAQKLRPPRSWVAFGCAVGVIALDRAMIVRFFMPDLTAGDEPEKANFEILAGALFRGAEPLASGAARSAGIIRAVLETQILERSPAPAPPDAGLVAVFRDALAFLHLNADYIAYATCLVFVRAGEYQRLVERCIAESEETVEQDSQFPSDAAFDYALYDGPPERLGLFATALLIDDFVGAVEHKSPLATFMEGIESQIGEPIAARVGDVLAEAIEVSPDRSSSVSDLVALFSGWTAQSGRHSEMLAAAREAVAGSATRAGRARPTSDLDRLAADFALLFADVRLLASAPGEFLARGRPRLTALARQSIALLAAGAALGLQAWSTAGFSELTPLFIVPRSLFVAIIFAAIAGRWSLAPALFATSAAGFAMIPVFVAPDTLPRAVVVAAVQIVASLLVCGLLRGLANSRSLEPRVATLALFRRTVSLAGGVAGASFLSWSLDLGTVASVLFALTPLLLGVGIELLAQFWRSRLLGNAFSALLSVDWLWVGISLLFRLAWVLAALVWRAALLPFWSLRLGYYLVEAAYAVRSHLRAGRRHRQRIRRSDHAVRTHQGATGA